MKAQRHQLYDSTDIDFYQQKKSGPKPPVRSATIMDFQTPSLISNTDDADDEGSYNEEEWEEEDYRDSVVIDRLFRDLDKKYDYSGCYEEDIIDTFRACRYNMEDFLETALSGELGHFVLKNNLAKAKPAPKPPVKKKVVDPSAPPPPPKECQHGPCHHTPSNIRGQIASTKPYYTLVIVGHVDAGKSTLMGHLLVLTGKVQNFGKLEAESKKAGKGMDSFAWVMSESQDERVHGVTIDVAMKEFETPHRHITLLDAPGHRDFVPNMIAGASQADSALLVVDASNPLIDRGQAREHLILCRALGVTNIIVAVNKMDSVLFDQSAFDDVKQRLTNFLKGLGWNSFTFIPTSATQGVNIIQKSNLTPWYTGSTLIDALDNLNPIDPQLDLPFTMAVSESIDTNGEELIVCGRVESGFVCSTDTIRAMPADVVARVSSVKINGQPVNFCPAGKICELSLTTPMSSSSICVGSALIDPVHKMPVATQFVARISTFAMRVPLLKGSTLIFYRHAVDAPLKVEAIRTLVNKKTKQVEKKNPGFVQSNAMADVVFRLQAPLVMDVQSASKTFGRFIIRTDGETLGFGSISEVLPLQVNN